MHRREVPASASNVRLARRTTTTGRPRRAFAARSVSTRALGPLAVLIAREAPLIRIAVRQHHVRRANSGLSLCRKQPAALLARRAGQTWTRTHQRHAMPVVLGRTLQLAPLSVHTALRVRLTRIEVQPLRVWLAALAPTQRVAVHHAQYAKQALRIQILMLALHA